MKPKKGKKAAAKKVEKKKPEPKKAAKKVEKKKPEPKKSAKKAKKGKNEDLWWIRLFWMIQLNYQQKIVSQKYFLP